MMTIAAPVVFVIVAEWTDGPGATLLRAYASQQLAEADVKMVPRGSGRRGLKFGVRKIA